MIEDVVDEPQKVLPGRRDGAKVFSLYLCKSRAGFEHSGEALECKHRHSG
jgi:hypothetical protein